MTIGNEKSKLDTTSEVSDPLQGDLERVRNIESDGDKGDSAEIITKNYLCSLVGKSWVDIKKEWPVWVRSVQKALEALKYDVSESGILDEKTKAQVKRFQRKYGLTEDGAPGRDTIKKIVEVWNPTPKHESVKSAPERIVYDFSDTRTDWDKVTIDIGKKGGVYFNGVKSISPQYVSDYFGTSSSWGEKNLCFPDVKFLTKEVLEELAKSPYTFYFNNLDVVTSVETYDDLQRYKDKIICPEGIKISEPPQNFAKKTISNLDHTDWDRVSSERKENLNDQSLEYYIDVVNGEFIFKNLKTDRLWKYMLVNWEKYYDKNDVLKWNLKLWVKDKWYEIQPNLNTNQWKRVLVMGNFVNGSLSAGRWMFIRPDGTKFEGNFKEFGDDVLLDGRGTLTKDWKMYTGTFTRGAFRSDA